MDKKWDRTWPGVITSLLIVISFIVLGIAFLYWNSRGCVVTVKNATGTVLEEVKVSGKGTMGSMRNIRAGWSKSVRIFPQGESGLTLEWRSTGEPWKKSDVAVYVEGSSYKVRITIDPDGKLSARTGLFY